MRTTRPLALALAAVMTSAGFAACGPDTPTATSVRTASADLDGRAAPAVASATTASARWNALARQIVNRRELVGPLGIARSFALVGVAEYDAVVAVTDAHGHGPHAAARPSTAGAAAGAAAAVLGALYPMELAAIDSQLAADAALPADRHESFAAGVAIGRTVAGRALARAATDRTNLAWTGTVPAGDGFWRNAPAPAQPLSPRWGEARPWFMTSGDQFRPAPPPAFGTPAFLAALGEVRSLSDHRTPAQLLVAQFWGNTALGGPIGYWNGIALGLAEAGGLDELRTARTLALVNTAVMDASIGCWDAKYAYWYVRPFQADPTITTPVGRPNFPSYPSAHSCLSAAAAGVIAGLFPDERARLDAAVAEAGEARIYAGLHFRFDVTAGQQVGYAAARLALHRAPHPGAAIPLD